MSNNPFSFIIVVTAVVLIASGAVGIIAPSFNVDVPKAPISPSFPDFKLVGNFSEDNPFDQTRALTAENSKVGLFEMMGGLRFNAFQPWKVVIFHSGRWPIPDYFTIARSGYADWYMDEPISFVNGSSVTKLTPQLIVDNFDGYRSAFVVDRLNKEYEAFAEFTPLADYGSMEQSWNEGHGFTLRMYGKTYQSPDTLQQAGSILLWVGGIIIYIVYFFGYMISTAGVLFTLLGVSPAISSGIVIILLITLVGSILMFLRGSSGGSAK